MAFLRDRKTLYAAFAVLAVSLAVLAYSQGSPVNAVIITPTAVNPDDMRYTVLTESQLQELAGRGWQVVDGKLHKTFEFESFVDAFQFMYKVGLEAEAMNHHPDWTNSYGTVSVYLYTWSADNSITDYDARLAGVMDGEAKATEL